MQGTWEYRIINRSGMVCGKMRAQNANVACSELTLDDKWVGGEMSSQQTNVRAGIGHLKRTTFVPVLVEGDMLE